MKVDRSKLAVDDLHGDAEASDGAYGHDKTPVERLRAVHWTGRWPMDEHALPGDFRAFLTLLNEATECEPTPDAMAAERARQRERRIKDYGVRDGGRRSAPNVHRVTSGDCGP